MKFKRKRKEKARSVWLDWWLAWLLMPAAFVVGVISIRENIYWLEVKYQVLLSLGSVVVSFVIMVITGIKAWRHPKRSLPRFKNIVWFMHVSFSCGVIMLLTLPLYAYSKHLKSTTFNDHKYHLARIDSENPYGHNLKLYQCDKFGIRCQVVCESHLELLFQDENSWEMVFSSLDQADILVDIESQTISITIDDEPVCTYSQ